MLDNKQLRNNIAALEEALKKRGFALDVKQLNSLEAQRKKNQMQTQTLQNARNTQSKAIAKAKTAGENITDLLTRADDLGDKLDRAKTELADIQTKINGIVMAIPNLPHASVPLGKTEKDNVEVSKWGLIKSMDFEVQDHVDLGEKYGLDLAAAAKMSAARFSVMSGQIARLHRALTQFMLDRHIEKNGYTEAYVPYLVNAQSLIGTGQLPKFEADLFKTHLHGEQKSKTLYLIPTGEVPITNIVRDTIVAADDLPLKFVAHTPSFRSEAGSYGKDTRGLIRQHQFEKVELVQVVRAEDSYQALEQLTEHAQGILQALELPYRRVVLCTGDLGFAAAKTYDLEVWLPGQNAYREISSCSCFEDFQARRLQLRWKNPATNKSEFLHTINGSGLAVGRTLVALLENHQQADRSIKIPEVLQKYMNNKKEIK